MLSSLYSLIVQLRNTAYDRGIFRTQRVRVPVISVGNITAGGTGKTPVVEALLGHFLSSGRRTAVITRGYRRRSKGLLVVSDGQGRTVPVEQSGDEAAQVARNFPAAIVVADAERVRGCRYAQEQLGAEVLLLDDAFQHRAIGRDCDILVLDARTGIASLRMLPTGRLREPLRNLRRADVILLSRCESTQRADLLRTALREWTDVPVIATRFRVDSLQQFSHAASEFRPAEAAAAARPLPPGALAGERVLAFCGIGSPAAFRQTLEELGFEVAALESFADHHWYDVADLRRLQQRAQELGVRKLLTTQKDAMRLHALPFEAFAGEIWYPQLALQFLDGEEEFFRRVEQCAGEKTGLRS